MTARPLHLRAFAAALLAALVLTTGARAQTVTPVGRTLVLSSGKSGTVKIDAGECQPTWTAVSANENVATVTPASGNASSKRTFKIKAAKGLFGEMTTVSVTLSGAGLGCKEQIVIDIQVFVVMDVNSVTKTFSKGNKNLGVPGVKGRLKTLKQELKDTEKALQADYKQLTAEYKSGNPPPTEGSFMNSYGYWGVMAIEDGEDMTEQALAQIEQSYWQALEGLGLDAKQTMSLYGFVQFVGSILPIGFGEGACLEWDKGLLGAIELTLDTLERVELATKKFDSGIAKLAAKFGEPIAVNTTVGSIRASYLDETGGISPTSANTTADQNANKGLNLRKVKARNYVDSMGSNQHGSLSPKGEAKAGTVTVTYERMDADDMPVSAVEGPDYFQDADLTVNADCTWRSRAPGLGTEPNLRPGRWRVTVTQDGESKVKFVNITPNP